MIIAKLLAGISPATTMVALLKQVKPTWPIGHFKQIAVAPLKTSGMQAKTAPTIYISAMIRWLLARFDWTLAASGAAHMKL